MKKHTVGRTRTTISRRTMFASSVALGAGFVSGCLGDSDGNGDDQSTDDEHDDHRENVGDDVSEEDVELAVQMIETVNPDLPVSEWRFQGTFVPSYTDSRGVETDASILGDAFAEIVDQGFDYQAMPTALDNSGHIDFMVFLEPEWATAYLEGAWTADAYYAEIIDSEH